MKGFGRGEPLSTFGKPPDSSQPLDAERFMELLHNYVCSFTGDTFDRKARLELAGAVEEIFRRLGG